MPSSIDNTDPIIRRISQNSFTLQKNLNTIHSLGTQSFESSDKNGVVRSNALFVSVASIHNCSRPVREHQYSWLPIFRTTEYSWNINSFLQCGSCKGNRCKDQLTASRNLRQLDQVQSSHIGNLWRSFLFVHSNLCQQIFGVFIVREMMTNWLEQFVKRINQSSFQFFLGNISGKKFLANSFKVTVGRFSSCKCRVGRTENNIFNVIQARVFDFDFLQLHRFLACILLFVRFLFGLFFLLSRTIGAHDLALHILGGIFHKDGRIGIGFGHFFLSCL
mmetsp:Transcript_1904/g.4449  ORF Transcript_1904/g.4449 Transcript_1904/m.4449 type:complete len:276 (-) Transcript_1904:934-1761(-)